MPDENKLDLELDPVTTDDPNLNKLDKDDKPYDTAFLKEHGIEGYDNISDFMADAKEKLSNKTTDNLLTNEQQVQLNALTTIAASKGQTLEQYIVTGGVSNVGGNEQFLNLGFNRTEQAPNKEDYLAKGIFTKKIEQMVQSGQLSEADASGYKLMAGVNDELMNPAFKKIEDVMQLLLTTVSSLKDTSTNNEYQMFPKKIRAVVPKGSVEMMVRNGQAPDLDTATLIYLKQNRPDMLHVFLDRNVTNTDGIKPEENVGDNMPIRKTKSSPMESNLDKINKSGVVASDGSIDHDKLNKLIPKIDDQLKFLKGMAQTLKPK